MHSEQSGTTTSLLDPQICQKARLSRDARFDGKFFTAVLSTGIYCRPVCPARPPKPENIVYYQSAMHAQQAGFQPCKRCFPELAPSLYLSVKMKQLTQALETSDGNIALLAQEFSMNERQLHRLFVKHYGVPPSKFLHHQRLLLARKLLSTTTLSVTDICFASGFQSIRRFNEAIKATYLCTPTALRKKTAISDNNIVTVLLPYRPPFDWSLMLGFFRHRQMAHVEQITERHYRRTFALGNCTGWLEVSHHKQKSALELKVSLSDYRLLNQVIMRVKRMFDLDADMTNIHDHLSSHPILASVIEKSPGLRLPGCWDIFEFSIRAILGQQISVKAATTYADRIAVRYGKKQDNPFFLDRAFPTCSELKDADFADMGLTNARVATLQTWLLFYECNKDIFNNYPSIENLENTLTKLKGIGPWTVNYIAMRGLSDPDAFPSADLGIIKALSTTHSDTISKPNNKAILAMAEQWRPWRAYAAIYLWQSLALKDNEK